MAFLVVQEIMKNTCHNYKINVFTNCCKNLKDPINANIMMSMLILGFDSSKSDENYKSGLMYALDDLTQYSLQDFYNILSDKNSAGDTHLMALDFLMTYNKSIIVLWYAIKNRNYQAISYLLQRNYAIDYIDLDGNDLVTCFIMANDDVNNMFELGVFKSILSKISHHVLHEKYISWLNMAATKNHKNIMKIIVEVFSMLPKTHTEFNFTQ